MALNLVVKVHPVVLIQIVDSYERRQENADRSVGTLLGNTDKGFVEVTNCFCVPHNELEEEVAMELDFARDMYELHHKVNQSEVIVGWYATGNEVTDHSLLIHDYYTRECSQPIHLTVDTTFAGGKMSIKAYISLPMGVPYKSQGTIFAPIPVEVMAYEPETVGVKVATTTKYAAKKQVECVSELTQIATATTCIEDLLGVLLQYVEDVISGKIAPDNQTGRMLVNMINSVPKMDPEVFEEMLNTNVKDLLMVIYLSQLTKTQLELNEKLSMLAI